ncbi:uncharacterized protein C8Q71DRAFT_721358 [Rhodofomes roseus]|uniref:Uncharacterized protein n=1 Tax=Rhodofomes roseus TaxID=34475 RepID=A0ABQ8KQL7_9APHY|nr:uncharacterized protein C8Q71DRAFT_721358 [Rhodofomes roseus]KAH9840921.1 hypothetical protein C8Q71DRAFT_721358 [Rhodofomes roseus]
MLTLWHHPSDHYQWHNGMIELRRYTEESAMAHHIDCAPRFGNTQSDRSSDSIEKCCLPILNCCLAICSTCAAFNTHTRASPNLRPGTHIHPPIQWIRAIIAAYLAMSASSLHGDYAGAIASPSQILEKDPAPSTANTLESQLHVQRLDSGYHAWASIVGGFFVTVVTSGYTSAFGVYQDFYTREGPVRGFISAQDTSDRVRTVHLASPQGVEFSQIVVVR